MKKTTLNFLWHMHQPYYRDDQSGEIIMPWVFLHAIKDYYDMPWYLERIPGVKATFNLVPSLLVQLKAYESFDVPDKLLSALRKEVDALDDEEKNYLARHLFFANVEHMIKPLARYDSLYEKKMLFADDAEVAQAFDHQEWLDLQVLYLLAWCGVYLRTHNEVVRRLLDKGALFTQEEKIDLLRTLADFIKTIIPYYQKLAQKGRIEISTTPFNHPITPLLLDIENGKRANPQTQIPTVQGSLHEDALEQIDRAIAYYHKVFGTDPVGFWPAEGAVSYDFLEILQRHGVKWAATDEEILYKTLKKHDKNAIYRRNILHFSEGEIALFFRDHALSDLIGFTYSGWDATRAVEDFLHRLEQIHQSSETDTMVNVILDGENAWEYYPNNADTFFRQLYTKLAETPWLETGLMSESMQNDRIPQTDLQFLEPGSWIGGNFNIWIGHPEKNRAWELIYRTKADYDAVAGKLDPQVKRQIRKEFLVAESSDWFWWYGDDHHTDEKDTFDMLFRKHLINIYHLMNRMPPQDLFTPIISKEHRSTHRFLHEPISMISPQIDGRISNFFEWIGAGEMHFAYELSAMNTQNFPVEKMRFGWDREYCYFALEGEIFSGSEVEIILETEDREFRFISSETLQKTRESAFCSGKIFELAIEKERIWNRPFRFQIEKAGSIVQQLPLYSKIELAKMDHLERYWFI